MATSVSVICSLEPMVQIGLDDKQLDRKVRYKSVLSTNNVVWSLSVYDWMCLRFRCHTALNRSLVFFTTESINLRSTSGFNYLNRNKTTDWLMFNSSTNCQGVTIFRAVTNHRPDLNGNLNEKQNLVIKIWVDSWYFDTITKLDTKTAITNKVIT